MDQINNNRTDLLTDRELIALFDANERGLTREEALHEGILTGLSPEGVIEAKEYWKLCDAMRALRTQLTPSASLAQRVVKHATAVSSISDLRTSYSAMEDKSIASPYAGAIDLLWRPVRVDWRVAAPITVIFLGLVSVFGMSTFPEAEKAPTLAMHVPQRSLEVMTTKNASIAGSIQPLMALSRDPARSDSVSEIIAALSGEADGEGTLLADADQDVQFVSDDSQSVNDFHNAYDETTF